ncbi:MAG: hypothetical protein P4L71_01370 [Acetobacteraceae bacterium]|nr:hypothetical protein [Acetobacteraceae bacterium]
MRRIAMSTLVLTSLTAPGQVAKASEPPPNTSRSVQPGDPLSSIAGSSNAWSVSRIETGCYLISPRRSGSSSLAIGRHATLGLGLFLVNFALAEPVGGPGEPVVIRAQDQDLTGTARRVGFRSLFVPLSDASVELSLQELQDAGRLWVMLKHTWVAHDGQGIAAALADYRRTCVADGAAPGQK